MVNLLDNGTRRIDCVAPRRANNAIFEGRRLGLKQASPLATPVNQSMPWTGPRPDCFMGPGGAAVWTDNLD